MSERKYARENHGSDCSVHLTLSESQMLDRSMQMEYADIIKLMKETKVFISPELKAETAYNFGSYDAFRKRIGNKLKVTVTDTSAVPLDVFWRELSESRPEMFDAAYFAFAK